MLRSGTFSFNPDFLDVKGQLIFAHICGLSTESVSVERTGVTEGMEYIFQLIESAFLYYTLAPGILPSREFNGKVIKERTVGVLSLPFKDKTNNAENEQWNDLVQEVTEDFGNRIVDALRNKCTYEQLSSLILDRLEDFDYSDRCRMDAEKLTNLVVFVYDYCILTMKEACLFYDLDEAVNGVVTIRNKEYVAPLRICAAIDKYEPYERFETKSGMLTFANQTLPSVRLRSSVNNPHANNSYMSAMFVDLMHKFFLDFGLKKYGKSEWAKPEKKLINELLQLFGLCKSSKSTDEPKYPTTVLHDYGDYFTKCNLRSWIREGQAYSYLMCCTPEELTRKGQAINDPFLSLDSFEEVEPENEPLESPEVPVSLQEAGGQAERIPLSELDPENLPIEFPAALVEMKGKEISVSHEEDGLVSYAVANRIDTFAEIDVEWDPRLDYVRDLINSSFEYITFLPFNGQYLVTKNQMQDPEVQEQLERKLEKDLLGRLDVIPRDTFEPGKARSIIASFWNYLSREDRAKIDVDKLYVLFLFIFDYVILTYDESATSPYLRMYIPSEISNCGHKYSSTMLTDDMLMDYLSSPFIFKSDGSVYYEMLRDTKLYVPQQTFPTKLPSSTVKNKTALFYDLFVRFFKSAGLTKRSDVKYVSDYENSLISELASCCGICVTDKLSTARTMFMSNKDYFRNSSLRFAIRENEYGYLMLNTMSDELFGPKTKAD